MPGPNANNDALGWFIRVRLTGRGNSRAGVAAGTMAAAGDVVGILKVTVIAEAGVVHVVDLGLTAKWREGALTEAEDAVAKRSEQQLTPMLIPVRPLFVPQREDGSRQQRA